MRRAARLRVRVWVLVAVEQRAFLTKEPAEGWHRVEWLARPGYYANSHTFSLLPPVERAVSPRLGSALEELMEWL